MSLSKGPRRVTYFAHGEERYRVLPPTTQDPAAYDVQRERDSALVCRFLMLSPGAGWVAEPVVATWQDAAEFWRTWMDQAPLLDREILVRRMGDATTGRYLILRAGSGDAASLAFQLAYDLAREAPSELADLLEVSIRRADRPGHPWVCTWARQNVSELWTFRWCEAADDLDAPPLDLE